MEPPPTVAADGHFGSGANPVDEDDRVTARRFRILQARSRGRVTGQATVGPTSIASLSGRSRAMDPSLDRYLHRIDGLEAQIWVGPSRCQLFWLRHLPSLFGAGSPSSARLARWFGIATVTPATNVTGLNLRYQAYLNLVFHRTRLAGVGHAICMPLIVAATLAALCPLRLGSWPALPGLALPVNASLLAAIGLAAWWAAWAVKERDAVWGTCGVALVAALYSLANVAYLVRPQASGVAALLAARSPGCWSVRCSRPARTSWNRCRPELPARNTGCRCGSMYLGRSDRGMAPGRCCVGAGNSPRRPGSGRSTNSSPQRGCCPYSCWNGCGNSATAQNSAPRTVPWLRPRSPVGIRPWTTSAPEEPPRYAFPPHQVPRSSRVPDPARRLRSGAGPPFAGLGVVGGLDLRGGRRRLRAGPAGGRTR